MSGLHMSNFIALVNISKIHNNAIWNIRIDFAPFKSINWQPIKWPGAVSKTKMFNAKEPERMEKGGIERIYNRFKALGAK